MNATLSLSSPACRVILLLAFALRFASGPLSTAATVADELPGDRMLAAYFEQETTRLSAQSSAKVASLADWTGRREAYREQLREMLGLSPLPERTGLHPVVTGRIDQSDFFVEKLHFQSLPGLYVTGNLYVPKNLSGKAPAILYTCGHAGVSRGPVAYGAKSIYQYHGAWLARNGYVCLTIDTIEIGDIIGVHKGTKRDGMWWWNSRGYTPAGVETWNAMRALDYLQSRPEVDGEKLGMTGRSGGGVTTWFTAALDDRIKVAVPVAGITDLRNHVLDRCIANHCDCAYMVNTYRWDNARLAALLAPRPLLMGATDRDQIFPLDGVLRIHAEVAPIYDLYQATDKLGLLITEGQHTDSQDLQVPGLRWFNRFLKGENPLIENAAKMIFERADLAVFAAPPVGERVSTVHEFFVPAAAPAVPPDAKTWSQEKESWRAALREKSFAAWPADGGPINATRLAQETNGDVTLTRWEFASQGVMRLPLFVFARARPAAAAPLHLHVLDDIAWPEFVATFAPTWSGLNAADPAVLPSPRHRELLARVARGEITLAYLAPRGIGPTRWGKDSRARIIATRSFMALGQTVEGMRVWDIRRAIETLRRAEMLGTAVSAVQLAGERNQAVNALYASLFTEDIASLELIAPPASHRAGPDYLNVLRYLDIPQAVALAAERTSVTISGGDPEAWKWAASTAQDLGWPGDRLTR